MFNLKFFIILCACLTLIAYMTLWPKQQNNEVSSEPTLTIGLESSYPPYEFVDSNGNIIGFDIDLANEIAKKMNKRLVIKVMEFEGLILALQQDKIDMIMSGMNITPSRQKAINMVPYHGETQISYTLMFWNEIPAEVKTLEDISKLKNPTIAVQTGSVQDKYLAKFPSISVKTLDGATNPLIDVKYGKSAAALVNTDVAKHLQVKHPEIKILEVPLSPEDFVYGFGIGIKKENEALTKKIKQTVEALKQEGLIENLSKKWFKE